MLVGGVFAVLLLLHSKSLKETAKNVFFITLPIPLFLFLLVFSIIFLELILSGPNLKAIDHLGTSLMIFGLVFGMVILVIWPLILLTFGIKIGIFAFNRRKQNLL